MNIDKNFGLGPLENVGGENIRIADAGGDLLGPKDKPRNQNPVEKKPSSHQPAEPQSEPPANKTPVETEKSGTPPPVESHSYPRSPKESVLESNAERSSGPLGGGANESLFVELKDDGSGVFKPKKGEASWLGRKAEVGTYYKRERAAYLLDRFLNLGLVPPTVIREVKGDVGSFQEFIPDAKMGKEFYENPEAVPSEGLKKLWIFDFMIWNSDRHGGNFLVKDGQVYAIDNGLAFSDDYLNANQSFYGEELPEDLKNKIKKLITWPEGLKILQDLLTELLSPEETGACLSRIKFIARIIDVNGKIPIGVDLEKKYLP